MAKRLSELGIMIVFGYTLWLIVSRPTLEGFFAQRAVTRLASFINRPSKQNYSIIFIFYVLKKVGRLVWESMRRALARRTGQIIDIFAALKKSLAEAKPPRQAAAAKKKRKA